MCLLGKWVIAEMNNQTSHLYSQSFCFKVKSTGQLVSLQNDSKTCDKGRDRRTEGETLSC